jgi:hypothetical protein
LAEIYADDSIWLPATLCKVVDWTYLWAPCQERDPKTKISCLHLKVLEKIAEIYAYYSIWWLATVCKVVGLELYVGPTSRTRP